MSWNVANSAQFDSSSLGTLFPVTSGLLSTVPSPQPLSRSRSLSSQSSFWIWLFLYRPALCLALPLVRTSPENVYTHGLQVLSALSRLKPLGSCTLPFQLKSLWPKAIDVRRRAFTTHSPHLSRTGRLFFLPVFHGLFHSTMSKALESQGGVHCAQPLPKGLWSLHPNSNFHQRAVLALTEDQLCCYVPAVDICKTSPFFLHVHLTFVSSSSLVNKTRNLAFPLAAWLSRISFNKSWWFHFHHISQSFISLTILISFALVHAAISFLLFHRLFCSPPGKLLLHLSGASGIICRFGEAERRLEATGFPWHVTTFL